MLGEARGLCGAVGFFTLLGLVRPKMECRLFLAFGMLRLEPRLVVATSAAEMDRRGGLGTFRASRGFPMRKRSEGDGRVVRAAQK